MGVVPGVGVIGIVWCGGCPKGALSLARGWDEERRTYPGIEVAERINPKGGCVPAVGEAPGAKPGIKKKTRHRKGPCSGTLPGRVC